MSSSSLFDNSQDRRRAFKKNLDSEALRRRRGDEQFDLRRKIRVENLAKRRQAAFATVDTQTQQSQALKNISISKIYEGLMSNDPKLYFENTVIIRKILSIERNPPIQQIIDCGAVPRLIELCKVDQPKLQFEAAQALTNIASGNTKQTLTIIQHGGVLVLLELLKSPSSEVREQAIQALGNIAGDSPTHRDLVLNHGVLEPLIAILNIKDSSISLVRNICQTLSNLCRGRPQPNFEIVKTAIPTLAAMVHTNDNEIISDCCWALSYLSDEDTKNCNKIQTVIESGCVERLVEILKSDKPSNIKTPALRTLGNIITGSDKQTQVTLNCGFLEALSILISSDKKNIRKEACQAISNITAGNSSQIEEVLRANLIGPLLNLMKNDIWEVKREATWALSNATNGLDEQIKVLVREGVIGPFCDMLLCPEIRIVIITLDALLNILKAGKKEAMASGSDENEYASYIEAVGGLDKLEDIQAHESEDVYRKAVYIVEEFFSGQDEQVLSEMVPGESESTFQFGSGTTNGGGVSGDSISSGNTGNNIQQQQQPGGFQGQNPSLSGGFNF